MTRANEDIMSSMRASISPMPASPASRLQKKPPPPSSPLCQSSSSSEGGGKPIRHLNRIPSFRKAGALLRRYPSLTHVRQLSSCRFDSNLLLDASGNFSQELRGSLGLSTTQEQQIADAIRDGCSEPTTAWEEYDIEVAPGVMKRLRGSKETQAAWERDECVEIVCVACGIHLACILDCEAVVCPDCLSLSPFDEHMISKDNAKNVVGLGIKLLET